VQTQIFTNNDDKKRIAKNTIMLYLRMLFTLTISLYTSRVVLNILGVEDFGIYNVVGGIVVMFGFLNNAMSASTQRFLTFEMGRGNLYQLNKIFNMSLLIHTLIACLVLILAETIGLWFLNTQLNISNARLNAANTVYQFTILSFIITILYVPFNAILIAHEKMKVFAFISILEVVFKLLIVFTLIFWGFDKLKTYALLVFFVSLLIGVIYSIYGLLNFEECKFRLLWEKKLFKEMSSFANWNLLGVFAGLTCNQGVNILLNIFFGSVVNAARGVAYQVQGAVNSFVTNFQLAVNPQIIKSYSIRDKQYMNLLIFRASKYSFFLLLVLSLPLLIETEFILKMWLKTVPEFTVIFTKLILIDILICSISGPLQTLAQATGNISKYQTIVSGILLMNLPLSYIFLKLGNLPETTFLISIFCSTIAFVARLFILNELEPFPLKDFLLTVVVKILLVSFSAVFIFWIFSFYIDKEKQHIFFVVILSTISILLSIWILGINKSEKGFIKSSIVKFIPKLNI
jgi:O-antigen/teichoic acid export membrane protein